MSRPTTSFTLPISGYTCALVTYYTKGEDDAINAYGLSGAEMVNEPDPETGEDRYRLKHLPLDRFRREVGKLLELGIASAKLGETDVPVGASFVTDLPTKDAETLSTKLIAVRSGTADPKEVSPAPTV